MSGDGNGAIDMFGCLIGRTLCIVGQADEAGCTTDPDGIFGLLGGTERGDKVFKRGLQVISTGR